MAELATVARPYAEALFKSNGLGDVKQTAEILDGLALLANDEQVKQFTLSPKTSLTQVIELLGSVLVVKFSDGMLNFLTTLLARGCFAV